MKDSCKYFCCPCAEILPKLVFTIISLLGYAKQSSLASQRAERCPSKHLFAWLGLSEAGTPGKFSVKLPVLNLMALSNDILSTIRCSIWESLSSKGLRRSFTTIIVTSSKLPDFDHFPRASSAPANCYDIRSTNCHVYIHRHTSRSSKRPETLQHMLSVAIDHKRRVNDRVAAPKNICTRC